MKKKFKPVRYNNIERLCRTGILTKGALIKYRWCADTVLSYQLDVEDEEWYYGLVTEVMWYVTKPTLYTPDSKDMLCHEISVRETSDNKHRMIDLDHFEILILSE